MRLVGAAQVRLADDLDQRRSAAIEVHIGISIGVREPVVNTFAGVVLHVHARNSDPFVHTIHRNIDVTMLGQRLIILRDLISLGQIRIEVVLAREARRGPDPAIQRQRRFDRQVHGLAAQHGQRSGQAQANWTNVRVRLRAEAGGAATKDLRRGSQLDVHLQADHRLVARNLLGRGESHKSCRHIHYVAQRDFAAKSGGGIHSEI